MAKGVDLIVEAFLKNPEYTLYIAGPNSDKGFWDVYGDAIKSASNISYEGFLLTDSKRFRYLCSICSFVILSSASEGCCSSVATCMRAGIVPVVNYETDIDLEDFGILIPEGNLIENIRKIVISVSNMDDCEYVKRVFATLKSSLQYTQSSYTNSFYYAIMDVLIKSGIYKL